AHAGRVPAAHAAWTTHTRYLELGDTRPWRRTSCRRCTQRSRRMIVAAHQPHYLPWLGYLDKLGKSDVFVVMDDLQFEAQNYQNRQRLKLADGPAWLSVPLAHGSQSDLINEKRIVGCGSPKQHWQHRH